MRKILINTLSAVAALTVSVGAMAQITGSNHDMTSEFTGLLATGNAGGRICIYCHVPHHSRSDAVAPLWNRNDTTTLYTMYSSDTLDMTIAAQPQGVSAACLSCHDGSLGVDNMYSTPWGWGASDNTTYTTTWGNLGSDLSTDHPISVTYDPAQDTGFRAQVDVETSGLKFFDGDQLECASCHDVHYTDGDSFWISNDRSALCLTCHIK